MGKAEEYKCHCFVIKVINKYTAEKDVLSNVNNPISVTITQEGPRTNCYNMKQ